MDDDQPPAATPSDDSQWSEPQWECTCHGDEHALMSPRYTLDGADYCGDGIREQVERALHPFTGQSNYPVRFGDAIVHPRDYRELFTPAEIREYEEREREYNCPRGQRIYCPHPHLEGGNRRCNAFVGRREARASFELCPGCHEIACMLCGGFSMNSEGAHVCDDFEMRRFDAQMEAEGGLRGRAYQICPNADCRAAIALNDGCNHVVCPCGTQFCFICGERATDPGSGNPGWGHWAEGSPCSRYNHPDDRNAQWDYRPSPRVPQGTPAEQDEYPSRPAGLPPDSARTYISGFDRRDSDISSVDDVDILTTEAAPGIPYYAQYERNRLRDVVNFGLRGQDQLLGPGPDGIPRREGLLFHTDQSLRLMFAWMLNDSHQGALWWPGHEAVIARIRFVHHAHMIRYYRWEIERSDVEEIVDRGDSLLMADLNTVVQDTRPVRFNVRPDCVPADLDARRTHFRRISDFIVEFDHLTRVEERLDHGEAGDQWQGSVAAWTVKLIRDLRPILLLLVDLDRLVRDEFSIVDSFTIRHRVRGLRETLDLIENDFRYPDRNTFDFRFNTGVADLDELWQICNIFASGLEDGTPIGTFIDSRLDLPTQEPPRAQWEFDRFWLRDVLFQLNQETEGLTAAEDAAFRLSLEQTRERLGIIQPSAVYLATPEAENSLIPAMMNALAVQRDPEGFDGIGQLGRSDNLWTPPLPNFHGIFRRARGTLHRIMQLTEHERHLIEGEGRDSPVRTNMGVHSPPSRLVARFQRSEGSEGSHNTDDDFEDYEDAEDGFEDVRIDIPSAEQMEDELAAALRPPASTGANNALAAEFLHAVERIGFERFRFELERRDRSLEIDEADQQHRSDILRILPPLRHVLQRIDTPNTLRNDGNLEAIAAVREFRVRTMTVGDALRDFASRGQDEARLQEIMIRAATTAADLDEFAGFPQTPADRLVNRLLVDHRLNDRAEVSDAEYVVAMRQALENPEIQALARELPLDAKALQNLVLSLLMTPMLLHNRAVAPATRSEQHRQAHATNLTFVRSVWPARVPDELTAVFAPRLTRIMANLDANGDLPDR